MNQKIGYVLCIHFDIQEDIAIHARVHSKTPVPEATTLTVPLITTTTWWLLLWQYQAWSYPIHKRVHRKTVSRDHYAHMPLITHDYTGTTSVTMTQVSYPQWSDYFLDDDYKTHIEILVPSYNHNGESTNETGPLPLCTLSVMGLSMCSSIFSESFTGEVKIGYN